MNDIWLSKHFSFFEMTKTKQVDIQEQNRLDGMIYLERMESLCKVILEPIRGYLGCPLQITSGFRCQKLNKLLGGVYNSAHLTGDAADIIMPNMDIIFEWIWKKSNIQFGQLINERDGYRHWIHISSGNKCEVLLSESKKYTMINSGGCNGK